MDSDYKIAFVRLPEGSNTDCEIELSPTYVYSILLFMPLDYNGDFLALDIV